MYQKWPSRFSQWEISFSSHYSHFGLDVGEGGPGGGGTPPFPLTVHGRSNTSLPPPPPPTRAHPGPMQSAPASPWSPADAPPPPPAPPLCLCSFAPVLDPAAPALATAGGWGVQAGRGGGVRTQVMKHSTRARPGMQRRQCPAVLSDSTDSLFSNDSVWNRAHSCHEPCYANTLCPHRALRTSACCRILLHADGVRMLTFCGILICALSVSNFVDAKILRRHPK